MLIKKTKILIWAYLILIHVFLGMVLVKTDIVPRIYKLMGGVIVKDELTRHYFIMRGFHQRISENLIPGSVIFIGDSITQGLTVSAVHDRAVNFGIGGDTTFGVIQRLNEYKHLKDSKLIVLAIGVNDLKYRSDNEIIENIVVINEMLPPNLKVLISAILPVDEIASEKVNYNNRISKINSQLLAICTQKENCYFLNASYEMADATGNLNRKYHTGDGVHLNDKGYKIWIKKLRTSILDITEKQ